MEVKLVRFYRLQQNISIELHVIYMLKPFLLHLGEDDVVVNISNGYYGNNLTVVAYLGVSLLFPSLRLCQCRVTCAQPKTVGHTNKHLAIKKL